jgi:hypothetical protein
MDPLRVLIGYSMRSGSTLLQHILAQHSRLRSFSDLSSNWILLRLAAGPAPGYDVCVKPMDVFFLWSGFPIERYFNRFVWLTRDPRDAYLSSIESGYAYLLRRPGRRRHDIDVGLLERWGRIHRRYFAQPERWHLVRYEDLATDPEPILEDLQRYLGLTRERLLPFRPFKLLHGGDHKLRHTATVHRKSIGRHRHCLTPEQRTLFEELLGPQMSALGY